MAGFDFSDTHKGEAADTERYLLSFLMYAQREAERTETPNYGYALADIFTQLSPDDFGDQTNKWVFAAAQELYKANQHIDIVSIGVQACKMGHLTQAAASLAMAQICAPESHGTCTIIGWTAAIEAVQKNSALRRALWAFGDHYMDFSAGKAELDDIQTLADKFLRIYLDAQGSRWAQHDTMSLITRRIDAFEKDCSMTQEDILANSFLFPFKGLNVLTKNGMQRRDFWVTMAKSGIGKTVFAAQVAAFLAANGKRVVYVTGEETDFDILDRIITNETNISYGKVTKKLGPDKFTMDEWNKVMTWADKAGQECLQIYHSDEMEEIGGIMRLALAHNALDVLIVDHLQLLEPPIARADKRYNGEQDELKAISRTLHKWAQDYNIVVLALSQPNKGKDPSNTTGRLTLENAFGSTSIVNFANGFIAINPVTSDPTGTETAVEVLKCRKGKKGTVTLRFDGGHQRFFENPEDNFLASAALTKKQEKAAKDLFDGGK